MKNKKSLKIKFRSLDDLKKDLLELPKKKTVHIQQVDSASLRAVI